MTEKTILSFISMIPIHPLISCSDTQRSRFRRRLRRAVRSGNDYRRVRGPCSNSLTARKAATLTSKKQVTVRIFPFASLRLRVGTISTQRREDAKETTSR